MTDTDVDLEPLRAGVERAWTAIGLSSWSGGQNVVPVDPEPALVIALQLFGIRSRVGNELIDWVVRHARLLVVSRLRRLAVEAGQVTQADIETLIATVSGQVPRLPWTSAAPPLDGFVPSQKSSELAATPATSRLRARAVFGSGVRTDILYLLAGSGEAERWTNAKLVAATAMAKARVYEVTADLERAGIIDFRGSPRNAEIIVNSGDPLANAVNALAPRSAVAPWRDSIVTVRALIGAVTEGRGRTITKLAIAQRYMAAVSSASWGSYPASVPTGEPDDVRAAIDMWIRETSHSLGYALAYGPPVGVAQIVARPDETADLSYHAGKATPTGKPDLTWHIERVGSVVTTSGAGGSGVSQRIQDTLHSLVREALDAVQASGDEQHATHIVS